MNGWTPKCLKLEFENVGLSALELVGPRRLQTEQKGQGQKKENCDDTAIVITGMLQQLKCSTGIFITGMLQ